jgi:hypothetical protein
MIAKARRTPIEPCAAGTRCDFRQALPLSINQAA